MRYEKRGNELWWVTEGLIHFVYDIIEKQHYHVFHVSGRWFPTTKEKWTHNFQVYQNATYCIT